MPEISENVALPPHYYRDNFLRLCDTVESRYIDLLDESERTFLRGFRALSFEAQCLLVRLVSRVGPWFRACRLDYPELGNTGSILGELEAADLLEVATVLTVQELGGLYTRAELTDALAGRVDMAGVNDKSSLMTAIVDSQLDNATITRLLVDMDDSRIVAPLGRDAVAILQLLFFGNRRQSLTDFVLSDLGVTRYYPYVLDRGQRKFSDRHALEEYLACAALSDLWYELREDPDYSAMGALARELLAMNVQHDSSKGRRDKLCNRVARDLERLGDKETALLLYTVSDLHPSRERRARILEGQGQLEAARLLCEQIVEQPWCEDERDAANRILPRLRRALEGRPQPRKREHFEELCLQLRKGNSGVEITVAQALAEEWDAVHYVENKLMNALFGLAFWEQIFAPVPGVFNNPFQSVPGDMYDQGFRHRRHSQLQARMEQLAGTELREEIVAAYHRYEGYQCRWLDWRYLDEALVNQALAILPADHLLAIWDRMLFDPGENRRGFPDLLALGSKAGDYCFIEVKGPGDTLQYSQKRWLRFFGEQSIPACVARVEWLRD